MMNPSVSVSCVMATAACHAQAEISRLPITTSLDSRGRYPDDGFAPVASRRDTGAVLVASGLAPQASRGPLCRSVHASVALRLVPRLIGMPAFADHPADECGPRSDAGRSVAFQRVGGPLQTRDRRLRA